jgi:hypothetical protein
LGTGDQSDNGCEAGNDEPYSGRSWPVLRSARGHGDDASTKQATDFSVLAGETNGETNCKLEPDARNTPYCDTVEFPLPSAHLNRTAGFGDVYSILTLTK